MAYLLFVDESGQDQRDSPYEVLAGVAILDRDLWNLIQAIQDAEIKQFGIRYSEGQRELKAKKILKRKVFRQAAELPRMPSEERRTLAKRCLESGNRAGRQEIAALAQSKLIYVSDMLDICARFRCRVFASIVPSTAPRPPTTEHLRKDYAYLFERFFYFLEDIDPTAAGIVVFDELERSRSHILVEQMSRYFRYTAKGRLRSGQIIPEPFFVHSDLTTGVQLADLVAYLILWGFRTGDLTAPARSELSGYVEQVCQLRHRAIREVDGNPNFVIWSFATINDLRAREEIVAH
jgi:hypothetical protein